MSSAAVRILALVALATLGGQVSDAKALNSVRRWNSTTPHTAAHAKLTAQIVNGELAQPGWYPYVAQLAFAGATCDGVLVAEDLILTAAHCFDNAAWGGTIIPAADFPEYVNIGAFDLRQSPAVGRYDRRRVVAGVIHELYGRASLRGLFLDDSRNDIALLLLDKPSTMEPIPTGSVVASQNLVPGESLWAVGWGTTCDGCDLANQLMEVELPFVSDAQCRAYYTNPKYTFGYPQLISSSMICAGAPDDSGNSGDTCSGDSGGPLLWIDPEGVQDDVLIGLVSWGISCGGTQPGVYTDVGKMSAWIDGHADALWAGKFRPLKGCKSKLYPLPAFAGSKGLPALYVAAFDASGDLLKKVMQPFCHAKMGGAGYASGVTVARKTSKQRTAFNPATNKVVTLKSSDSVITNIECVPRGYSPCLLV